MKASLPLPILLAFSFVSVSCSRAGDLSGDVFVTNGEKLVRGAGVEISVIPASNQFEAELRKLVSDYDKEHKEYAEWEKAHKMICQKDEELKKRIESDPSIRTRVGDLATVNLSKKGLSRRLADFDRSLAEVAAKEQMLSILGGGKCPEVFRLALKAAWDAWQEEAWKKHMAGAYPEYYQDFDAAHHKLGEAEWRQIPLDWPFRGPLAKDRFEGRVRELVRASGAKAVLADVNGHYELNGLPVGRYYLSAKIGTDAWLVPVQIVPGAQKVHLSNANSGSLRFLTKNTPDS